ncbi:YrzI family small protein [Neobacillus vireti]
MTLNILFFSITFSRRNESLQQAARNEIVEKLYEQNKDRNMSVHQLL